jgi:hypothetical protein
MTVEPPSPEAEPNRSDHHSNGGEGPLLTPRDTTILALSVGVGLFAGVAAGLAAGITAAHAGSIASIAVGLVTGIAAALVTGLTAAGTLNTLISPNR